jgi:RHS repeat-associated protein
VATWNTDANANQNIVGLFWNHADWLGTERVRTDANGNPAEWCTDTPYGMNLNCTTQADLSPMHFIGKQDEGESGLDSFGARYFGGGNSLGRFMTPDPGPWILLNPQSYNAYSYALNNPLRFADDGGETPQERVNAAYALAAQGFPYRSGGKAGGWGLDCSGLVQRVLKADPDNPTSVLDTVLSAAGQASAFQQGDITAQTSTMLSPEMRSFSRIPTATSCTLGS